MIQARHNPFASHRVDALPYRFSQGSWEEIEQRLKCCSYRAAIIGPYGSGKTTMLEQLAGRLRARGSAVESLFVNADRPVLSWNQIKKIRSAAQHRRMICIDGADLLPRWQRWFVRSITRHAAGLVMAGHAPCGWPVLWECESDEAVFQRLLEDLGAPLPKADAVELFRRHQGNVRDMFRELYRRAADSNGPVQPVRAA